MKVILEAYGEDDLEIEVRWGDRNGVAHHTSLDVSFRPLHNVEELNLQVNKSNVCIVRDDELFVKK